MALPPLPLLLYAEPTFNHAPRRVVVYLAEKQVSKDLITLVPSGSTEHPPQQGTIVPVLAIRKQGHGAISKNPDAYHWCWGSFAIIEFLEDLCDKHKELSPMSSLKGGEDTLLRLRIHGIMYHLESAFEEFCATFLYGNKATNEVMKLNAVHVPSSTVARDFLHFKMLPKLELMVKDTADFETLGSGKPGAATLADIGVYVMLVFLRDVYSINLRPTQYPNIMRVLECFEKRAAAKAAIPPEGYPGWVEMLKNGWAKEVW